MKRTTIVIVAGLLAVATALPASAQTGASEQTDRVAEVRVHRDRDEVLDTIKRRAAAAVDRRLDTLDRMTVAVGGHVHVTEAHRQQLLADYAGAEAGLAELNGQIQAAETVGEVLVLVPKIAEDYRVYLVMVPKSYGVAVSDTIVAAGERIAAAGGEIQVAIDRATDAGVDASAAQEKLDAALADGEAAVTQAGPVADSVIGLDASDWPDPAELGLHDAHGDLKEAHESVRRAVDGLRASAAALRDALAP